MSALGSVQKLDVVTSPHGPADERVYLVESTLLRTFGALGSGTPVAVEMRSAGAFPVAERLDNPAPFYLSFPAPPEDDPEGGSASFLAVGSFAIGAMPFAFDAGEIFLPPFDFKLASFDFTTSDVDPDKPSEFWDGRILDPGSLERSIGLTPVGEAAVRTSAGEIVAANTDGAYDNILDTHYAVSQSIQIRLGQRGWTWRRFDTLWDLRITGVSISEAEIRLEVQDQTAYTDAQWPTATYSGDSGAGGDPDLASVQKPVVLGSVLNHLPQLVRRSLLIYQPHGGEMAAVAAVYDSGVPLVFDTDHASYTALAAASVPAGGYATCLAEGFVKLGSTPSGIVTCDCTGEADAGGTTRSIARYIAERIESELDLDMHLVSFDHMPEYAAGWVWTAPFTYAEALSRFVGDAGWVWGALQAGPIAAARLDPPDPADESAVTMDTTDILEIERLSLPEGYESTHKRRIVQYARNWHPMTDTDLAGAVFANVEDAAFRQSEWRQAVAVSNTPARNAVDPPVLETSLQAGADATALASQLIAMHGVRRRMFMVRKKILGDVPPLAGNAKVTYPRFGLSGGYAFRVVSIEQRLADSTAEYLLWG